MPSLRDCLELAGVFGKSQHAQSIAERARTYVAEDGYEAAHAERLAVEHHLTELDRQLDSVYRQAGVERPGPRVESQSAPPSTLDPRPSTVTVTADHLAQARAALESERPPDVLDDIADGVTKKGVSFPAEHKDTIGKAKGQAREMIRQRDGEPANQVLQALAEQNPKYADWTEGDLAEAMVNAGETRMRSSAKDRKAVQQAAEEIARAEARANPKPQTPNPNDPWAETIDAANENTALHEHPTGENLDKIARQFYGVEYGKLPEAHQAEVRRATVDEDLPQLPPPGQPRDVSRRQRNSDAPKRESGNSGEPTQPNDPIERQLSDWITQRETLQKQLATEAQSTAHASMDNSRAGIIAQIRYIDGQIDVLRKIANESPEAKADWINALVKGDKPEARDRIIDALNSLKVDTNGQLHAFGLLPEAWNTVVEIAVAAVRGGRKLGEAIDWAIEQIKLRYPNQLTDEAGARAQLMLDVPTRATGQKITASPLISDETKQAVHEYVYDPRSNRTDAETAAGIVAQLGATGATSLWRNPPPDLPGAVKSKLLGAITRNLAEAERQARIAGDTKTQEALVRQQADLWDEALPRITNTAQELQGLNDLLQLSPDAHVARAKRDIQRAGDGAVDRQRGETDAMRTALDEGRTAGIEAVKNDAETNTAAREAVNESIKASAETKRAVIMELAEPWAQSEVIVNHAREAVRAKANELLNTQPRPPGFTPAQHLRRILDDLAARAAGIFAGHIQGSEPGLLLVDKLQQRLGVDKAHASKLASQLSREWDKQLDAARKQLDTRLASARARQERREREPESNSAVDRALRKQLREMNVKLGDAIRQAASDRQRTGEHIADKITKASGLEGPAADALRKRLKARYDQITAEAQRNALAGIEARSGVKVGKKMREAFDRLIELDRLAPVDGDAFFKAVRAALKLPELTEAQARELRQLVLDAQAKPEGFQRQRIMAQALTLVENAKGTYAWHDTAFAVWYANIFSAPPTHIANLIGNTAKALEVLSIESLRHPLATGQILKAFARGVETGGLEAGNVLKTGSTEGTRLLKAEPARPLEAKLQQGGWNRVWLPFAAVARAMAAEDMVFFKGHEEVKWQLLARRIAKQEHLRGEQLDARVQDLMHHTRAKYEAAKVQAAKEGLSGLDARRRAHEIIEQQREASMEGSTDQARRFALEHTFNSEPYGVMGSLAEVLNMVNRELVVTRFAIPVVRIMANLANESLNYFPPVGLARVVRPKWRSDIIERAGGDRDALAFYQARAMVGTVLFAGLAAALVGDDDGEAAIEITGQGPRTKNQREQLRATGWKPNALRVGDRWYSYQESQLNIPLAIMGNYSDAIKYKGLDREDALNRVAYTAQTTVNTIFDQHMLSGVGDLMDALKPEAGGSKELSRLLTRSASSFVVPNAARWIDQVFDPAVYEADDVKGAIYAQTPFVRRENRAALNALGEPVTRPAMDRFTSPVKPDALMRTIAAKNAWIPMPNLDEQTIGARQAGPEYLRPMTSDEYYTWIAESGPAIRTRLSDALADLAAMTPPEAQAYVQNVTRQERAKTKPQ